MHSDSDVFGVQAYLLREVRGGRRCSSTAELAVTEGMKGAWEGWGEGSVVARAARKQNTMGTEYQVQDQSVNKGRVSSQIQWVMVYANKPKKRKAETHEGKWFIISHLWGAGA